MGYHKNSKTKVSSSFSSCIYLLNVKGFFLSIDLSTHYFYKKFEVYIQSFSSSVSIFINYYPLWFYLSYIYLIKFWQDETEGLVSIYISIYLSILLSIHLCMSLYQPLSIYLSISSLLKVLSRRSWWQGSLSINISISIYLYLPIYLSNLRIRQEETEGPAEGEVPGPYRRQPQRPHTKQGRDCCQVTLSLPLSLSIYLYIYLFIYIFDFSFSLFLCCIYQSIHPSIYLHKHIIWSRQQVVSLAVRSTFLLNFSFSLSLSIYLSICLSI